MSKWIIIIVGIIGLVIFGVNHGNYLVEISPKAPQAPNTEAQTSRTYAITNTIALTDQWSEPPVETDNNQGMYALVTKGQATKYEVRDADHPNNAYPFNPGETLHTDGVRIYKWQWRVSGTVVNGPLELRYTVYR